MVLHGKIWWLILVLTAAGSLGHAEESSRPNIGAKTLQPLDHDPLSPFTADEVREFLKASAAAERITDPMERCLRFPAPPGSHWSPGAVKIVCTYRLQETLHFAQIKELIEGGRSADIDRKLADLTRDPINHPEAMWRFLNQNFLEQKPESRALLEAWKQQSPNSSFAFLASGYSFLNEAWTARGAKTFAATPQTSIDAMDRIIPRAEGDLRKASELDSGSAIPYAVMIKVGMLMSDASLVEDAVHQGLRADPGSMPLYNAISMASSPRWGGSDEAQAQLLRAIDKQAPHHPLVLTVRASVLADQTDAYTCLCRTPEERAAYGEVFDQVAMPSDLYSVGKNALDNKQYELALIYLTEALRFNTTDMKILNARNEARGHIDSALFEF
jgi:hypothetical protein